MPASVLPTPPDLKLPLPYPKADRDAPQAMWWSAYARASSTTRAADVDPAEIQADLEKRHAHWADPTVRHIMAASSVSLRVATSVVPPLPQWAGLGGRCVLVGDAAHAMPSTSGQGVSQALSDAYAVALLLQRNLGEAYGADSGPAQADGEALGKAEARAMNRAWEQYVRVRKPLVDKIQAWALQMNAMSKTGQKGLLGTWFMYAFLWIALRLLPRPHDEEVRRYRVWEEVEKICRTDEEEQTRS